MGKTKNLAGLRFGQLEVLPRKEHSKTNHVVWTCFCDCGKVVNVLASSLISGNTKSCGCARPEVFLNTPDKITLANIRSNLKAACYNPNSTQYKSHGALGATLCDEWKDSSIDFVQWALDSGYKKGLALIRFDSSAPFSPSNCKWVTRSEKDAEKLKYTITYNNKTQSVPQWARELVIPIRTIRSRMKKGLPVERILATHHLKSV